MLAGVVSLALAAPATVPMNHDAPGGPGGTYKIANPPPGRSPYVNASRHAHRGEYIEVYSYNISTHYGEVYWTMQPAIPMPAEFVKRFDGQIVAFTGYEADAVRTLPDGSEEHVPLYDAYNHHHNAYIYGKRTTLVDVGHAGTGNTPGHGGSQARWEPRDRPLTSSQREQAQLKPSEVQGAAWIVDVRVLCARASILPPCLNRV